MSERTAKSLAALDALLPRATALAPSAHRDQLLDEAQALRRATAAFHMEAIRFRMHTVDRLIRLIGDTELSGAFDVVRHELETAGFHTRSHTAPEPHKS